MKESKIIILRENLIQSIIADILTFGFIVITFYFNYHFIGNSKIVNVLLLFMFFTFALGKSKSKTFYKKDEAIKYINNK